MIDLGIKAIYPVTNGAVWFIGGWFIVFQDRQAAWALPKMWGWYVHRDPLGVR